MWRTTETRAKCCLNSAYQCHSSAAYTNTNTTDRIMAMTTTTMIMNSNVSREQFNSGLTTWLFVQAYSQEAPLRSLFTWRFTNTRFDWLIEVRHNYGEWHHSELETDNKSLTVIMIILTIIESCVARDVGSTESLVNTDKTLPRPTSAIKTWPTS